MDPRFFHDGYLWRTVSGCASLKIQSSLSSGNHPALQCEYLHVTNLAWKELLVPWLKNRQMFPVGTNTTPAVIASSESGQPVILACLTRDKPSLLLSFGGTS
jgi:hypothetical protein